MSSPIFIIGSPRSGTTILGQFFETNSLCDYYLEVDIWKKKQKETLFGKFVLWFEYGVLRYSRKHLKLTILIRTLYLWSLSFLRKINLMDSKYDQENGHRLTEKDITEEKINRAKSYLTNKRLVVKHPGNSLRIPFIKKIFPDAKFVHILRDGKDVTSSMMNGPTKYAWAYIRPPGWKYWKKHSSGVIRCAWQWMATISIINSDRKKIPSEDYIEIRYEDLIENPEKTMRLLFEKLEIPFEEAQEQLCKRVQNKISKTSPEIADKLTVYTHSKRVGRYKENLSPDEIRQIEYILQKITS